MHPPLSDSEEAPQGEFIVPRHTDDPLLSRLRERSPEELDYLSVSYGLTQQLFRSWA